MFLRERYYLRLDDAHERMHLKNWKKIESLCIKYDIKPLVALIPNNKDSEICFETNTNNINIDDTVKRWYQADWCIGIHGYNHDLVSINPLRNILPLNNVSEFVHLSKPLIHNKLVSAVDNFKKRNIKTEIFVPPAHSYNVATLKILQESTDIKIVSDGWDFLPFVENGITFLPQQLWKFRRMYFGHWTICLHPSSMCDVEFEMLEGSLKRHSNKFGSFVELMEISQNYKTRKNSRIFKQIWKILLQMKRRK
jgi:predicted deacetylase